MDGACVAKRVGEFCGGVRSAGGVGDVWVFGDCFVCILFIPSSDGCDLLFPVASFLRCARCLCLCVPCVSNRTHVSLCSCVWVCLVPIGMAMKKGQRHGGGSTLPGHTLKQVASCVVVCRQIQGYGRQRGLRHVRCRRSGACRWGCAYVGGQGCL